MNSALLSLLSLFPAVISVGERNRFIKTTHTASNIIGFPVSYHSDLISKGFNRKALTPHAEHHSLGFFLPCLHLFLSWRQLKLTHQASMDMGANGTYTKCKLFFLIFFWKRKLFMGCGIVLITQPPTFTSSTQTKDMQSGEASWMCSRLICNNCVILSCCCGHISSTLLNLIHKELRQFWRLNLIYVHQCPSHCNLK